MRGDDGIKEIVYDYNGKEIKAAIVSGLANADQLLKKIKSGEIHYDFVEVMACRRGCVMGGGQPLNAGAHTRDCLLYTSNRSVKGWSDIFRICKAGAGAGITFGRAL